jgi:dTDP-4-dehydrorhamnose reductase
MIATESVLVTGPDGMLGRAVCAALGPRAVPWDVYIQPCAGIVFPINDASALVNCAGLVRGRDELVESFIAANSMVPQRLARYCTDENVRLVHISTDCVYSGNKGCYTELDLPDPPDIYARSKLLGEVYDPPHVTLRGSFIGFGLRGLLADMERALFHKGEFFGYRNWLWNGMMVDEFARAIVYFVDHPELVGLWHVFGRETVNKYELLRMCKERLALGGTLTPAYATPRNMTLDTIQGWRFDAPPLEQQLDKLLLGSSVSSK